MRTRQATRCNWEIPIPETQFKPIKPTSSYGHLKLIRAIQQPQPERDAAVRAVHAAQAFVREMEQALRQANQQLANAEVQLQQTIPAQQEHQQLVRKLQAKQCACWNQSLSAELSGLILGKTSRYNKRMVAVSCPLLRDTVSAAPVTFEISSSSRARITAGCGHMLCVSRSSVFAWGDNEDGQLGVGDTKDRVVPTLVIGGSLRAKSVVQITAGYLHTACVTADGLVFVWGNDDQGQLGIGDTEHRELPTLVQGELLGKRVLQVATGGFHTVCVTEGGAAYSFGDNDSGQLGLGDTERRLVPTLMRHNLQNKSVLQVAAGSGHTMCVTKPGHVFACGSNHVGQLGVGNTTDRLVPTLVTGQLQGKLAIYVAAGDDHTLCITANGSLSAWGSNCRGQLGMEIGDTVNRWVPMLVTGLQGRDVIGVAAGKHHTICTTADGCAFTWGESMFGALGLGVDKARKHVPTQVKGELQSQAIVQVAAGENHSACVTGDGSVYTWGNNAQGQLGVVHVRNVGLPTLVSSKLPEWCMTPSNERYITL